MLLLANVLVDTARSALNATKGTSAPTPYLSRQDAHGSPMTSTDYRALPAAALESDFLFIFETGADVVAEDIFTSVLEQDGQTPWSLWPEVNPNEVLRVVFAQEASPGFLPHRRVYVKKFTAGGPVF